MSESRYEKLKHFWKPKKSLTIIKLCNCSKIKFYIFIHTESTWAKHCSKLKPQIFDISIVPAKATEESTINSKTKNHNTTWSRLNSVCFFNAKTGTSNTNQMLSNVKNTPENSNRCFSCRCWHNRHSINRIRDHILLVRRACTANRQCWKQWLYFRINVILFWRIIISKIIWRMSRECMIVQWGRVSGLLDFFIVWWQWWSWRLKLMVVTTTVWRIFDET